MSHPINPKKLKRDYATKAKNQIHDIRQPDHMRSSNKSRSRNKNNNNRRSNPSNVLNRVFDSSGPEGKVRGTPQQIIDKYQGLASDAMLSGDRVNAENFLQHSEHYSRLLTEAQREINARREAQEAQRNQQNQAKQQKAALENEDQQPDIAGDTSELFPGQTESSNLVDTPENTKPKKKPGKPKKTAEKIEIVKADKSDATEEAKPETAAE